MKKEPQYNWRKIFWAGVLVCVIAYAFGEPYLEKWLGVELPSIRDRADVAVVPEEPRRETNRSPNSQTDRSGNRDRAKPDGEQSASNQQSSSQNAQIGSNPSKAGSSEPLEQANSYLTSTGIKNRMQSPAGLIYGMGAGGEHRVQHVMDHSRDDPSRPVHSVFDGSEEEILKLIDEAYRLIQSYSKRVRSRPDESLDFRVEHVVDMQRKIGYLGGQRGRRENHPPRSKIRLVLDNEKFVITAYPDQ